ncbi:MAG: hypothetical protein J7J32_01020 [Candidatus Atribacteria bacterium]|nr:hypothetical protein [Candidatus Atribacteria bacterium]MCD6349286.1 hypothetical protein [Candidatus Atribacteria bacterium]
MKKYVLLFLVWGLVFWIAGLAIAQPFEFEVSQNEVEQIDFLEISPLVYIQPDKGDFGSYYCGEEMVLYYESRVNGYVSIFDYLPNGKAKLLKNNEYITAGSQRMLRGRVGEEVGLERFLVLLSVRPISDRILIEAMRRPSEIKNLVTSRFYLGRCRIQVLGEHKKMPTFLSFSSIPERVFSRKHSLIRVLLRDQNGNPLVGRRIQWETSDGKLKKYQTFTNVFGESENLFYAPSVYEETPVTIEAVFEGNTLYDSSSAETQVWVIPESLKTVLTISPSNFRLSSGEYLDFTAELQDLRGEPVSGRSIRWEANQGSWEKAITYTDSNGKTTNRWFAPQVTEEDLSVVLKAVFPGALQFLPSEGFAYGIVSGMTVSYSGPGFYFLDFSSGKPHTNFEDLIYRGNIKEGLSINPVSFLTISGEDFVEAAFEITKPLQGVGLCLWSKAQGRVSLRVFVNEQLVFSGLIPEGALSPLDYQSIYLTQSLRLGRNRLRIEIDSESQDALLLLQRLMIFL